MLSATGSVVYAGVTGERRPLLFTSTMLVLSLIIGVAWLLLGRDPDDR